MRAQGDAREHKGARGKERERERETETETQTEREREREKNRERGSEGEIERNMGTEHEGSLQHKSREQGTHPTTATPAQGTQHEEPVKGAQHNAHSPP